MAISFPTIPETLRLPFAYAEFDPTGASDDPAVMPYTVLLAGSAWPPARPRLSPCSGP